MCTNFRPNCQFENLTQFKVENFFTKNSKLGYTRDFLKLKEKNSYESIAFFQQAT